MVGLKLDPRFAEAFAAAGYTFFKNTKNGYAYAQRNGKRVGPVHRLIMCPKPGEYIDHINGDKLDNRLENLRIATARTNVANRPKRAQSRSNREQSQYKGVHKNTGCSTWTAKCGRHYLGSFRSEEDAARAYDKKALELFGEYANLNFKESK